jgi:hypothetical protein
MRRRFGVPRFDPSRPLQVADESRFPGTKELRTLKVWLDKCTEIDNYVQTSKNVLPSGGLEQAIPMTCQMNYTEDPQSMHRLQRVHIQPKNHCKPRLALQGPCRNRQPPPRRRYSIRRCKHSLARRVSKDSVAHRTGQNSVHRTAK